MTSIILIAFLFIILLFHEFRIHRKLLMYEFYYFNSMEHNFGLLRLITCIIYVYSLHKLFL